MSSLARVRVSWSNFPGAPGVSTFWGDAAINQTAIDALRAFFNALVTFIPTGTQIQVPSTGDLIDAQTGLITGTWSVGATPAVVTCSGAGNYAGNAGAVVHWLTNAVVTGTSPKTGKTTSRRLRGRTFLVPLVASAFDTNGSLSTTPLTSIQTAANTFVTAAGSQFNVWHRPKPGQGENFSEIVSARVPDLAISLRSRRV